MFFFLEIFDLNKVNTQRRSFLQVFKITQKLFEKMGATSRFKTVFYYFKYYLLFNKMGVSHIYKFKYFFLKKSIHKFT